MSQQPRHVRLGIVHRGHVVAERVLGRRTHVSVGLRPDATVQIDAAEHPDFPAWMEILHLAGGRYHLVLPSDPRARVTLRGAAVDNVTVELDGRRCLPVEAVAGGSLQVGDVCVMFQFVSGRSQPLEVRERTVLRLGLVYEGRLIADRIYSRERKVGVGPDRRDTLQLDEDYRGPSLRFERDKKDGTATLVAEETVALRAALPGERPQDADALLSRGQAQVAGGRLRCRLPLGARGRARMGPYTVLFQVLRQRVEVPVLPRRSWHERVTGALFRDPVWAASLGMWSLIAVVVSAQAWAVHMSYGRFMQHIVPPEDTLLAESRLHYIDVQPVAPEEPEPLAPVKPPEEPEEAPGVKQREERRRKQRDRRTARSKRSRSRSDPAGSRSPRGARGLSRTVVASITGAGGTPLFQTREDGEGEVRAKYFNDAGGGGGGDGGPGQGLRIRSSGAERDTYREVRVNRSRLVRSGRRDRSRRDPVEVKVRVKLTSTGLDGPSEAKARIGRLIARRNAAVRGCYDAALRADPSLSAKVTVRFTVGTGGTITSVNVMGASGALAECIARKISSVRGLPLLSAPQSFRQTYLFTRQG